MTDLSSLIKRPAGTTPAPDLAPATQAVEASLDRLEAINRELGEAALRYAATQLWSGQARLQEAEDLHARVRAALAPAAAAEGGRGGVPRAHAAGARRDRCGVEQPERIAGRDATERWCFRWLGTACVTP